MQVILREDVENLGNAGDVVVIRPGYARNYLLPRGLAMPATAGAVKKIEHERRVIAARNAKLLKDLDAAAAKLSATAVTIARAVGEGDRLYGSVTSRDIAEAIQKQGVAVDAKRIVLDEPIKRLGLTEVPVKLGRNITATVKVWVVKQDA
ncbi:MAG: 50S ribosomal protein L9 [Myxococcales bacterium]|nr:50S ribosomal protein L9 [Myxococcales bacterium]